MLPGPAVAQEPEAPSLTALESGEAVLSLGDLLTEGSLEPALRSGLPLRIRVVVELWRDRFFDSEVGRDEWRATVLHDPLDDTYRVASTAGVQDVFLGSLDAVTRALERRFAVAVAPREAGRYYYLAHVELETLSVSDLEELGRWLRGDLAPAVTGEDDIGGAVTDGIGRLFVRVLGLPQRRLRLRTPTFEFR